MGFDAGAAVVVVVAAGAGFEMGFEAGGETFGGTVAVLADAVGFLTTGFAGLVDDGAAVPRYGTVVVVGGFSLAAPTAAIGRAVPLYCGG